jgi:hypothetical protein
LKVITERSMPDPQRPRLSDEIEAQLESVETQTAACYADSEDLAYQIRKARESVERRSAKRSAILAPVLAKI